ncbi:MAG TPA: OsmC family protein [Flavitalea sp.]|nr:OsmC family protein [Flavitalea sp.]
MAKVEVTRMNNLFGFDAKDANGHTVKIDTSPETGGVNYGVRPMQLLLMGLGGCSGIDILSILKKQRQEVVDFNISIEGDRQQGVEPSLWTSITIVFTLTGNIDQDKADKACALSIQKYCSVAETLRKSGSVINWKVVIQTA